MNLHALNISIRTGAILVSLGEDKDTLSYDAVKSAVTGVDIETVMDSVECCDTDSTMVEFLSFVGVSESVLEDMVSGRVDVSQDAVKAIAEAFATQYNDEDIENLAEEFAGVQEVNLDSVEEDALGNPPKCKAGYKRRLVIKSGKSHWKCVRISGHKILSAGQKMALVKARRKSHTSSAKYSRKRSVKIGKRRGLYK